VQRADPPALPEDGSGALHANRRGIRLMVAAMACFIANDAIVKLVSASLPATQLILVRGMMSTLLVLAVARAAAVAIRPADLLDRRVALRAVIDALSTFGYLLALFHMPIANATAINMAAPLFIVALAVPLLGERVDAARWVAVATGFAGVLLVIQPRADGFNAWALLCLGATLLHALRDLVTRSIPRGVSSLGITFTTAVTVTLMAAAATLPQGWQPMDARQFLLLAAASVFLSGGYLLITMSARGGDMSAIAPWRYTGLLWALVLGWVVWGDVPNALAWAGIALLIAAGLYLMRRERAR
jgi:drug/metabolite transporter (DMT)-like permease